jgi:hypothetical protein
MKSIIKISVFELRRMSTIQIFKNNWQTTYFKNLLLLSVQKVVACHAITVTNYRFRWCSAVINVICNTCFGSVICYTSKFYFEDFLNFHFESFGEN